MFNFLLKKLGITDLQGLVFQLTKKNGELVNDINRLSDELKALQEAHIEIYKQLQTHADKIDEHTKIINSHTEIIKNIPLNEENDIEKAGEDFIPVDDNFRIPIIDGLKVKFEGEQNTTVVSIKK